MDAAHPALSYQQSGTESKHENAYNQFTKETIAIVFGIQPVIFVVHTVQRLLTRVCVCVFVCVYVSAGGCAGHVGFRLCVRSPQALRVLHGVPFWRGVLLVY